MTLYQVLIRLVGDVQVQIRIGFADRTEGHAAGVVRDSVVVTVSLAGVIVVSASVVAFPMRSTS